MEEVRQHVGRRQPVLGGASRQDRLGDCQATLEKQTAIRAALVSC